MATRRHGVAWGLQTSTEDHSGVQPSPKSARRLAPPVCHDQQALPKNSLHLYESGELNPQTSDPTRRAELIMNVSMTTGETSSGSPDMHTRKRIIENVGSPLNSRRGNGSGRVGSGTITLLGMPEHACPTVFREKGSIRSEPTLSIDQFDAPETDPTGPAKKTSTASNSSTDSNGSFTTFML